MAYGNPYLNMLPAVQQQLIAPLQQQANALNMLAQGQQPMQMQQPVQGQQNDSPFVTKEEFNQLLEENKKLKDQLDKELTQRSDMEFFKKEQEVLKLDEGRRAFQEIDYSKQQYFTMLWKTSPMGKEAMQKYRDTVESIYNRYTQQPATPVQEAVIQQLPAQAVESSSTQEKQVVEEQQKKYNVVSKNTSEVNNK